MPNGRILVVEDEPLVAEAICEEIERLGYTVADLLSSGESVLEAIGRSHPDLILLDIRLEGVMDGIDAATRLRLEYDTPIIYLTAHSDPQTLERAAGTLPSAFLIKPFTERELAANIAMTLASARSRLSYRERLKGSGPLLDALKLPALLLDSAGLIVLANEGARDLLRVRSAAELRDEPLTRFVDLGTGLGAFDHDPADRECSRVVVASDGTVRDMVVRIEALVLADGTEIGSFVIFDRMKGRERGVLELSATAMNAALVDSLPGRKSAGPGYEVGGFLLPCPAGSGDLFDVFPAGKDRFCFFGVDVMGHGSLASLIAWSLREHIREIVGEDLEGREGPAEILGKVSRRYRERTFGPGSVFFSALIGVVDRASGAFSIGRAGHPPVIILRPGSPVEVCRSAGRVIGITDELAIGEISGDLGPGSRLLLFSDGFLECLDRDADGLAVLQRLAEERRNLPNANFIESFRSLAEEGQASDDASFLVIERPAPN